MIVAPPGSSSMPSGDNGPLQQGARDGLDWFSVATEASSGGTPDLGYFLEVWEFIGEVGVKNKSGGPHGKSMRHRGTPRGVGIPPTLVGPP